MRSTIKHLPAVVTALALAMTAGAAFADPIATAGEKGPGTDIRWVRNSVGTGGHLFSGGSSASSPTAVLYNFNFNFAPLDTLLGTLGNGNNVELLLNATAPSGNPASGSGIDQQQTGLNGWLQLIYTGSTPLPGCIHLTCTNLLTASFSDAWLVGGGAPQPGSHSSTISFTAFNDPSVPGSSVFFTSDFTNFTDFTDLAFDFAFASPTTITHQTGKALSSFNASSTGTFEGVAIPEPATWALMILGFGGAGAALRRRRRAAALA
ncbi:MAG TPA: PEPxxWA-CTERM sorting domain-containing protein [Phenylobacterium sp.]|nr:PEPxxWA-CTERM sorting domain-containing protein [Phenylobacterium sp.]